MGEIHVSLCESMPKGLILCSELASRFCSPSLGVILTPEGLAAVRIDKKWGYIETTGRMVIEPQEFWNVKPFHNGLAQVQTKDTGVGYIDRSGKYVWGPHKRDDATTE